MIFCYSCILRYNHTLKGTFEMILTVHSTYTLLPFQFLIEQILLVLMTKKFVNKTHSVSSEYAKSLTKNTQDTKTKEKR